MVVVAFQASRLQKEAGLVLAGRHRQIIVSVLPKLWRNGSAETRIVNWSGGTPSLYVELYEGDTCCISCPPAEARLVEELLRVSSRAQAQDAESGPDGRPLLEVVLPPDQIDWLAAKDTKPSGKVAALVELARRGGQVHYRDEVIFGRPAVARTLEPLLCQRFVDEVQQRAPQLRRSYVTTEETLSLVRGRVIDRDLISYWASGDPTLRCRFDSFTEQHPLFQVIATALDVVAQGAFDLSAFRSAEGLEDLPRRAAQLRRFLGRIRSLPPASALMTGRTITLDRFSRGWQTALDLALHLLRGLEYLPDLSKSRVFPSFELGVKTWRVWETILANALKTQIDRSRLTRVVSSRTSWDPNIEVSKPWSRHEQESAGNIYPDLFVYAATANGFDLWCLDAKYKVLEDSHSVAIDDLYQIFAYSHLTKLRGEESDPEKAVSRCALIYPSRTARQAPIAVYRREPVTNNAPDLYVIATPFPEPEDLGNNAAWQSYLNTTGARLVSLLGLASGN